MMPKITINGLDVQVENGATVFEAAEQAGIYIPTLCHHPDLPTFGGCRVCMVDADGKIVTACRAPVKDGMVVKTDTEEVRKVRLTNVELLLASHHKDCQSCSRNNTCKLQEVSAFVGISQDRMRRIRRSVEPVKPDDSNPFFHRDFTRCVLCGICIRTCEEINGVAAIDFAFRGFHTKVSVLGDKPIKDSQCESCGECLVRCPTGALYLAEPVVAEREVESVCTYCGVGCGIKLGVRGDRVVKVEGNRDNPVNRGDLCVKGRFGHGFINHPERLKKPLIKRDGIFVEASWDEALDFIADKMSEIKANHGADALGGISSARCTSEENYLFQKIFRAMGTNNVDHCARL